MNITIETMKKRKSCRSFSGEPLSAEERDAVSALMGQREGPFGNPVRFALVEIPKSEGKPGRKVGTYGIVQRAPAFIVGAVRKGPGALEDYGYRLEGLVLGATALGLGTCWLGGSFSRSDVAKNLGIAPDELCPAVTPVGRPADVPSLRDRLIRGSAGSDRRLPATSLFFDGEVGRPLEDREPWAGVLEAVRFGPSASNKQPWRIVATGERDRPAFHLYLAEDRAYNNALGEIHIQNVDMGIAMCNFETAARSLGLFGSWHFTEAPAAPGNLRYISSWLPS
jgi:nitroreductase